LSSFIVSFIALFLTFGIRAKVTSLIPSGQLLRGDCCRLHSCPMTEARWAKS